MTTTIAKKSITRSTKKQPWRWPRGMQLGMQEDDHDHNQEKCDHEHKKTQRWVGRAQLRTEEDDHDHG